MYAIYQVLNGGRTGGSTGFGCGMATGGMAGCTVARGGGGDGQSNPSEPPSSEASWYIGSGVSLFAPFLTWAYSNDKSWGLALLMSDVEESASLSLGNMLVSGR